MFKHYSLYTVLIIYQISLIRSRFYSGKRTKAAFQRSRYLHGIFSLSQQQVLV
jgi:hypothetical protein